MEEGIERILEEIEGAQRIITKNMIQMRKHAVSGIIIFVFAIVFLLLSVSVTCFAKQHRSKTAIRHFKKSHPCPSANPTFHDNTRGSCPGYVIDHIVPLACMGPDDPSNMQWQTIINGKIKDRFELSICGK